ncbi:hypothetical protein D3C87_1940060 [compost metagenome]
MQADRLQVVFCCLEEGAGPVVGQQDRRAVGAEQSPEVQAWIHIGSFGKAAGDFFRPHPANIPDFTGTEMGEFGLRQMRVRFFQKHSSLRLRASALMPTRSSLRRKC